MPRRGNRLLGRSLACATLLLVACSDPTSNMAQVMRAADAPGARSVSAATLVECPTSQTLTTTGIIGPLGGALSVGGLTLSMPLGAVRLPTTFTLTVPASRYLEISIRANDLPHFEFLAPVSIAIDYSRCSTESVERAPLSVFHIDETTKALLEHMGGTDDRAQRRILFTTDHLSGYAIAN